MSFLAAHRYLLARRGSALGILALFWLGANTHSDVLRGNLSSSQLLQTVPLSDPYAVIQILATGQSLAPRVLVGALLVLLFYAVVGGRAFCGWVCPVAIASDGAHWLRRRLEIHGQFQIPRSVRSWIMLLALPVSAASGVAAFEWLSPVGIVQRELILGPGLGLVVALATLAMLDVFVVRGGWCGSLCPLGAFYSLVGRFSLVRVGFNAERCDRCGDCVAICPEPHVIEFHALARSGFVASGDCRSCARCLEVCPRDAYHFALRPVRGVANDLKEGEHHGTNSAV